MPSYGGPDQQVVTLSVVFPLLCVSSNIASCHSCMHAQTLWICCPLRNQFLGCVEIVLKTLMFIILVTYLYDISSSEGPEGPNF